MKHQSWLVNHTGMSANCKISSAPKAREVRRYYQLEKSGSNLLIKLMVNIGYSKNCVP